MVILSTSGTGVGALLALSFVLLLHFCYDRASWTIISLPLYPFSFPLLLLLCYRCSPSPVVIALSWTYSPIPKLGQDALRTVHLPLSITCPTLALTVLPMHASVSADVHRSCPSYAHPSSLLPYVSLHRLCMLPDPLTCVTPRPLYAF